MHRHKYEDTYYYPQILLCKDSHSSLFLGQKQSYMEQSFRHHIFLLGMTVYIDETYVHEDASKIYLLEEIGKVKKQPRGNEKKVTNNL